MKKTIFILSVISAFYGYSNAENVYMWNGGTAEGRGYVWADDDSYGTRIVWRRGSPESESYDIPTSADVLILNNTGNLQLDIYKTDIEIAALNCTRWNDVNYKRLFTFYRDNSDFTVSGNFSATQGLNTTFASGLLTTTGTLVNASLKIGGDVTVGQDNYTVATTVMFGNSGDTATGGILKYLEIGGNVYLNNNKATTAASNLRNRIAFNVGTRAGGEAYDINTPDILIKGSFQVLGTAGGAPYVWINNRNSGLSTTSVMSVGGLDGSISIYSGGSKVSNYDAAKKNYTLGVLVFTQGTGQEFNVTNGTFGDSSDAGIYCEQVKVKLVMNGTGVQKISNGKIQISGGIDIYNGKLLVNNVATGATGYTGDDTSTTLFTHGDLNMNFGTFGFYLRDGATESKAWSFNNINWTEGTLQLCVYESFMDTISLDQINGVGGKFSLGTDGQVVAFDFVGNLDYLYNNETKIVSWSDFDSGLKYTANDGIVMGNDVKAVFREDANGLYVKYVNAVPEPAAFALIFGAAAIALVLSRRRK